jgi:phosphoribosylglycinamide formyltransferase-1
MTKKLAVLGSGDGSNLQNIVEYFKDKNLEITCISDVEDSPVLKTAKELKIEAFYLSPEKNAEYFRNNRHDLGVLAGYNSFLDKETLKYCDFINIHPSLLPAFPGKDAMEAAFKSGVKVSGVTVHYVEGTPGGGKIIAQYPVFIDVTTDFAGFEAEIRKVEHKLYPFVIESVLDDVLFSFDMLLKPHGCGGSCDCGGCGC